MAQLTYSLYNSATIEGDQQLAVEIGNTYLVLVVGTASTVAGFEYYDAEDNELEELLSYAKTNSYLLEKSYSEARVYYNLEESVLVPVGQFNTAVASEFVDVAFGSSAASRINVENINVQPGMVNVYRSSENWQALIAQYFRAVTKRHLFSKLIEHASGGSLQVQFYKNEMTVIAIAGGILQLARNFSFDVEEDIVYHLLNSCKQTGIDPVNTSIEISGLIDTDSKAIRLIKKCFGKIQWSRPPSNIMPQEELSKYPLHYFTSFFKLLS
jgi:hypothetical protein